MPEIGSVVDKYVVERKIGRGGTASVYRVRHRDLGVVHALKVLTAPDPDLADRLRLEGRLQAQLSHPNVLAVFDVLEIAGLPALVTELVDGPSLDRVLERGAPPLPAVDDIARGVLKGVRAAHLHGLIHRDLKPANVLLAPIPYPRSEDAPVPKIADFGLAKRMDAASITREDLLMGTPAYMAPERFHAARAGDVRSDVYALGVLLYELCSGVRPYDASDLLALGEVLRTGRWPPIHTRAPALPDRMADTIERAMALDPADRFASVDEMLDGWLGAVDATVWHPGFGGAPPGAGAATPVGSESLPDTEVALSPIRGTPLAPPPEPWDPALGREPSRPAIAGRDRWWPAAAALLGAGAGAGLVGAIGAGLFAAGLVLWSRPAPVAAVEAPPPVPAAPPAPVPPPANAPARRPTRPVAEPEPEPEPLPAPAPALAPEPTTGTVTVAGDTDQVRLRDAAGRWWAPGELPPGRYVPAVTFSGGAELVLELPIVVAAGQRVTVDCRRAFFSCTAR